ncbi:MAG TPA: ABC transporter ATP-binding protein [Clostridiales bacterium]|nr:ABC transporter ATP-binding protein [Clostridiales bacterium]
MTQARTIIETRELTKRYGDIVAVDSLNLSIRQGEVFGLLGPNGAGKTTTTLMLLGLTEPTSGSAYIEGHNCTREPIAVKKLVGYLPDNVGFYGDMTGRENLRFTGQLNGMRGPELEKRIDQLLERVGMTHAADRKAGTYSRGMKQRLGIADVLIKNPSIVIMDEPTLGIDPEGMWELLQIIRELAEQDGRTVLISSHQLYQVQQVCDRVGIFVKGKLIACGGIKDLANQLQAESGYSLELEVVPNDSKLENLLKSMPGVDEVTREGERFLIHSSQDIRGNVTQIAAEHGYSLQYLRHRGGDLDEIYRRYFEKAGEQQHGRESGPRKTGNILQRMGRRKGQ